MRERCKHCQNGWFSDQRYGTDVECVNGVLIDIDVAHDGWQTDTVYPPAPCIAKKWRNGNKPGWGDECQRLLDEWACPGTLAPADTGGKLADLESVDQADVVEGYRSAERGDPMANAARSARLMSEREGNPLVDTIRRMIVDAIHAPIPDTTGGKK